MTKLFAGFSSALLLLASAGAPDAEPLVPNPVLARHADELRILRGDELVAFDSTQFRQASYTILYFGAGWCPDCRRFSPNLVSAYDQQGAATKRFEVLLLSRDKNPQGLLQFMRSEKMKWPALAFDKLDSAQDLQRYYSGHGIPCLTVIDSTGKVVLQSKDDQDANEVLQALQNLLIAKKDR
jgi:thiol-disulfide isomerase/thioredoxin